MSANGLRLAPEKSECVVLTNKYRYREPNLYVQGCQVPVKKAIRYLGVQLDTRLSFVDHVRSVTDGSRKATTALGRLMPNIGGPSQSKRHLLMSVVHSRLLYGAVIWSEQVSGNQECRNLLLQAQRHAALKVARCYRTVSDMAALLLARMSPAFLLASSRKRIAVARRTGVIFTKQAVETEIIQGWQALWESTPKAAWTKRLIPDLSRWWYHGPRQVSFHMAQTLTNHRCFQKYLWTRDRAYSPACSHCPAKVNNAEHTIFACVFWSEQRRDLALSLGRPVRPEDVQDLLCDPSTAKLPTDYHQRGRILSCSRRRREMFVKMVERIMGRKEELERAAVGSGSVTYNVNPLSRFSFFVFLRNVFNRISVENDLALVVVVTAEAVSRAKVESSGVVKDIFWGNPAPSKIQRWVGG
ncbi:hypothetical protein QTP88_013027 [Uroleucon formosanum]